MKHYEKLAKEYATLEPTSDTIDEVVEDSFLAGYKTAMEELKKFGDEFIHLDCSINSYDYLNREAE